MKHKITFNYPDEESFDVSVDGQHLGSFNHDDHGWDGMSAADSIIRKIAIALDVDVEVTEELNDE